MSVHEIESLRIASVELRPLAVAWMEFGGFHSGTRHRPGQNRFLLPQTHTNTGRCFPSVSVGLILVTFPTFMTDRHLQWRPTAAVPPRSPRVWRPSGRRSSLCCGRVSSAPGTVGKCPPYPFRVCCTDTLSLKHALTHEATAAWRVLERVATGVGSGSSQPLNGSLAANASASLSSSCDETFRTPCVFCFQTDSVEVAVCSFLVWKIHGTTVSHFHFRSRMREFKII